MVMRFSGVTPMSGKRQADETDHVAEINMFAGDFAPSSHFVCDGALIPISTNTLLYSLIGTDYGGNGMTNFGKTTLEIQYTNEFDLLLSSTINNH